MQDSNTVLEQQLDDINSKFLAQFVVQNADTLTLQDELKKCQEKQDIYCQQAEKAQMVPSHRRLLLVSADSDTALLPAQLYQQVLWDHNDLNNRYSEIF